MKYEAVTFDLYGTLIDNLIGPQYTDILRQVSSILSVPINDFRRLWSDTIYERHTGVFQSVADNLVYICHELGIQPHDNDVKRAARIRHDYARKVMTTPRSGAIEVLSQLKSWGGKTGLISNCTADAPAIWPDTPFAPLIDVAVFSCTAELMKPDPGIYQIVIEQLAVEPNNCLYVADGVNQELNGASKIGMHPVRIKLSGEDSLELNLEEWDGPVISSLTEVLSLIS